MFLSATFDPVPSEWAMGGGYEARVEVLPALVGCWGPDLGLPSRERRASSDQFRAREDVSRRCPLICCE